MELAVWSPAMWLLGWRGLTEDHAVVLCRIVATPEVRHRWRAVSIGGLLMTDRDRISPAGQPSLDPLLHSRPVRAGRRDAPLRARP